MAAWVDNLEPHRHRQPSMGNTASDQGKEQLETSHVSRKKLQTLFRREAKESLTNIELISISRSLFGDIEGLNQTITFEKLLEKLELQVLLTDERGDFLYNFLKRICNWPCLSDVKSSEDNNSTERTFSLYDVLILVSILQGKGFQRIGMKDDYFIHLLFIVLISTSVEKEPRDKEETKATGEESEEEVDLIIDNKKIKWNLLPIVQSFDKLEDQGLSRRKLREFLNILLPLSVHSINSKSFSLNYTTQINSIITTLLLTDNESDSEDEEYVSYNTFISNYHHYCPHLFSPLKKMFLPLLYEHSGEPKSRTEEVELNYKILNLPLLSQLSTILDIDSLDMTINSKPLYQGSKDGYSINSIQSHTLNYRASTLLLISGKTIDSEAHLNSAFFSKFPKFHPVLNSDMNFKEKTRFQIAVFITEPWRITNTKNFGSKGFQIIQLSPFQIVLNSNNSLKEEYAYFSNIGCGLGFGSKPPVKSKDVKKNSLQFSIGGVSLTVDNSLEMGNFRVEDMSIQSSTYSSNNNVHNRQLFNDLWFRINEIEIYGLGSLQSLKDQKLAMEWEEREAERRRGLNSKDYQEGRALLELAGIIGGGQSGGSV